MRRMLQKMELWLFTHNLHPFLKFHPIGGGAGNLSLTREYQRIFTIVRDETEPVLWDNISARTKLLFRMKEMGAILKVGGKPHLRFNILKELPNTSAYTDLDTLTPVRPDPFTSVVFEWKQLNTPVQVSGLDMVKTGDEAIIQLLTAFLQVAETSMRDAIGGSSVGIFSSAGESDLTSLTGLQNFFTSSVSTGSVGQLSRASQSAWRHIFQNISNDFSSNGINRLRTAYRQTSFFDDTPDTIVGTGSFVENYELNLTENFQVNFPLPTGSLGMAEAGFENIKYKGAVMFDDDGAADDTASATIEMDGRIALPFITGKALSAAEVVTIQGIGKTLLGLA
ncbi:hypothetical protein LCGC14_2297040 [marine sediment metagenome]|uniref:Major capsid protein n=1 Tax=marine sediment metagenome TaxID=412755 RepID=A0A0F9CPL8_9ZZZZ